MVFTCYSAENKMIPLINYGIKWYSLAINQLDLADYMPLLACLWDF